MRVGLAARRARGGFSDSTMDHAHRPQPRPTDANAPGRSVGAAGVIVTGGLDPGWVRAMQASLRALDPGAIVRAGPVGGAGAVCEIGETAVSAGATGIEVRTGESRVVLPTGSEAALVAGVIVGQRGAATRLAEARDEQRIEQAVRASAARLIDEQQVETTLAVLVQRALLPPVPEDAPGVDASVLYRPCASLSGDLYDIVRLDEHHVAFFLADACGHGVAAALLTMLIGRLLPMKDATHHAVRIVPPGEAMARLNAAYVQRQPDSSRLITAIYGVLDTRTGQVTLASAGHPPAAIVGPRGWRLVGDSGPALGMSEDAEYPQLMETLAPGEAVLLYSDGFEWAFEGVKSDVIGQVHLGDRRRPNDRYLEAFGEVGARLGAMPMRQALEGMVERMDRQSGSLHQPDDMTLVAVCFRGTAAASPAEAGGADRGAPAEPDAPPGSATMAA